MDDRIYKTEDYSKFKKLLGNRDVTETRVRKIVNSIRENGYILSPICVNERSEIIDGQGRLEAQRRLKLPVYYYIAPGTGIKECVAMNRYTSKWTVMDFISCIVFGRGGEFAEKYLHQGTKICVSGRIQTGSYTNKDGQKVYTTDVVVEDQEFAESRRAAAETQSQPDAGYAGGAPLDSVDDAGLPFA